MAPSSNQDGSIEAHVERLEAALHLSRSIDGLLVSLESELLVIREEADRRGVSPEDILRRVLESPRLRPLVGRLKCCEGELFSLIETPRFRGLRRYRGVLEEVLRDARCVSEDLVECGVPAPAWVKEKAPVGRDGGFLGAGSKGYEVRVRISRLPPMRRGDVLAYGFLALLAVLTLAILLLR